MVRKLSVLKQSATLAASFGLAALLAQSPVARAAGGVAMAGKVVSVEGNVLVRQDSASGAKGGGQAVQMKPGVVIKEGDVINTASDGKAKILLEDKTILDIGSSALFKVQKFEARSGGDRNVDLSMPYGTTQVSVSKPIAPGGKFQIRTRTATMGVRGTVFVVQSAMGNNLAALVNPSASTKGDAKAGASETKVTVIQGKVEVQPAKTEPTKTDARKPAATPPPVMLTAGTQLTASSDASKPAPKAVTLDSAQLSAVSTSTKVTDNTFAKAVTLDLNNNSGGSSGNNGSSSDSGAGGATRAALAEAIAAPQNQAPPVLSSGGFIGTFSANSPTLAPPVVIPVGGLNTIHIVVKQ